MLGAFQKDENFPESIPSSILTLLNLPAPNMHVNYFPPRPLAFLSHPTVLSNVRVTTELSGGFPAKGSQRRPFRVTLHNQRELGGRAREFPKWVFLSPALRSDAVSHNCQGVALAYEFFKRPPNTSSPLLDEDKGQCFQPALQKKKKIHAITSLHSQGLSMR